MPSFDTLTELEYLYYSVGFFYFKEQQQNDKISMMETIINQSSKLIEYYTYELADIKFILFDISSSVRGIGGVKSCLKPSDLPSYEKHKEKIINEAELKAVENETPEEREERHRKFFEELKAAFKK